MSDGAITPRNLTANGLINLFTNTKKWTITCGACLHTWKERLPVYETCSAICPNPNCRKQNLWRLSQWMTYYDENILGR